MSRLPRVTGKEMIAALERAGFRTIRKRGSHRFVAHEDGRATVVPVHSGETLGVGLTRKILRDCDLTVDEFARLLSER